MCIGKSLFRTALIGGIVVGVASLIWHDEATAMFHHVKAKVSKVVDNAADDPVVLRQQLRSLAEELPKKISELRGEIAEVDSQITQLDRDSEVAKRVVAMTTDDLHELDEVIAQADSARATRGAVRVSLRFKGDRMDLGAARREFNRISRIRVGYQDRLAANERDLRYLKQQRTRLSTLLHELESEYATIETQMWQIDRKIDAIARSERLAETLKDREAAFEDFGGGFDSKSLQQLQAKIRNWETKVEAEFKLIEDRFHINDYEREAEAQMEFEEGADQSSWMFEGPPAEEEAEIEAGDDGSFVFGYRKSG